MYNVRDTGFILKLIPHAEDGMVLHVLTAAHGRMAGYVPRAKQNQRLRGMLEQGQHVSLNWQAKTSEQLGTLLLEEDETQLVPLWGLDPQALAAWQSAIQLLETTCPERQAVTGLYEATQALASSLTDHAVWPALYIRWELGLLASLGYGLTLDRCVVTGSTDKTTLSHVSPKSGGAVSAVAAAPYVHKLLPLPPFLRGVYETAPTAEDITNGLTLSGHFINERVLNPLSKTLPPVRDVLFTAAI